MYSEIKKQMPSILEAAGEIVCSASHITDCITAKAGDANFVTEYDVNVQNFLKEKLTALCPGALFFAEEQENDPLTDAPTFLIDPIDGTTNFIRGLGQSCISVGFYVNKKPVLGYIYQPYARELFYAYAGEGAYLAKNGKTTRLSRADVPLSGSLSAFGTDPYRKSTTGAETMRVAGELLARSLDIRRTGSAALDLINVAAGRCDLLYENLLSPWDFGAGRLIVEEAGGVVMRPDGKPLPMDRPSPILAGAPSACAEFLSEIGYRLND